MLINVENAIEFSIGDNSMRAESREIGPISPRVVSRIETALHFRTRIPSHITFRANDHDRFQAMGTRVTRTPR